MDVIFGYIPGGKISSVYWKDSNTGEVTQRTLRTDGTVTDKVMTQNLYFVLTRISSSHYWTYPAVVNDIRTAFKYLGKNPDLVELLPEAEIGPDS
jgi:hypothetical protein